MTTISKRIQVTPHDGSLAVLALDRSSEDVRGALVAYARLIDRATSRAERALTREEWNYLADCLNGCADLWSLTDSAISTRTLILAEAEDADRLNRLGDKWAVVVPDLLQRLRALDDAALDAILVAVRHFWKSPEIDASHDDWWTVESRTRRPEKEDDQ